MKRFLQRFLSSGPIVYLLYLVIRCYTSSFRVKVENEREWMEHLEAGGRVLVCTWHQHFFSAIRHFESYRSYRPGVMVSQSRDGDIIAGVANRSGWITIRGSSSRAGKEALAGMIAHLRETRFAGHVVDGPRGPAWRVKAGLIRLAHAAEATIVPFYVTVDRAWYFNSWDHFFIPKPLSKVVLRFGAKIELAPTEDTKEFEAQRLGVESVMRAGSGIEPPGLTESSSQEPGGAGRRY